MHKPISEQRFTLTAAKGNLVDWAILVRNDPNSDAGTHSLYARLHCDVAHAQRIVSCLEACYGIGTDQIDCNGVQLAKRK